MYKNLSAAGLGISGRLSELIELTLTHGFRGFDFDLGELFKSPANAIEQTKRMLRSAKMDIGGFELPTRWRGAEADYQADLAELPKLAEAAAALGATRCHVTVLPASDEFPYHENFELHRKRIAELAAAVAPQGVQLGLGFLAAGSHRVEARFQFLHQPETLLLLIKTIRLPNVGLALDTWNWHVGGGNLEQLRELTADQVVLVRLGGLPTEVDPSVATDEQRLLPGEGVGIDHDALLAHLVSVGYEGPVTAYPHPSAFVGIKRDAVVQKTAAALDALFTTAGISTARRPLVVA